MLPKASSLLLVLHLDRLALLWKSLPLGDKAHRCSVHAVALPRGRGPIIEHMAQVGAASRVNHLYPGHERDAVVWHLQPMHAGEG